MTDIRYIDVDIGIDIDNKNHIFGNIYCLRFLYNVLKKLIITI